MEQIKVKNDDFTICKDGKFKNSIIGFEYIYGPITDEIPRINIDMVQFVRMQSLSKELYDKISEELGLHFGQIFEAKKE